jgi:hypothetical protein
MAQDPNAWWSKEIGDDFKRGFKEVNAERHLELSRIGRIRLLRNGLLAVGFWMIVAGVGYALYRLLTHNSH